MLRVQAHHQDSARTASARNWLHHKMAFAYFKVTLKPPEAATDVFLDTLARGNAPKADTQVMNSCHPQMKQLLLCNRGQVSPLSG